MLYPSLFRSDTENGQSSGPSFRERDKRLWLWCLFHFYRYLLCLVLVVFSGCLLFLFVCCLFVCCCLHFIKRPTLTEFVWGVFRSYFFLYVGIEIGFVDWFQKGLTERETDRQTETETDRQRQRDGETGRERERERERETETETETDRQTDRDRDRECIHVKNWYMYTFKTMLKREVRHKHNQKWFQVWDGVGTTEWKHARKHNQHRFKSRPTDFCKSLQEIWLRRNLRAGEKSST